MQYDPGTSHAGFVNWSYEAGTRRLEKSWVQVEGVNGYQADVTYAYDAAGNRPFAVRGDGAASRRWGVEGWWPAGMRVVATSRPEGPRAVFEPTGSLRDAVSTISNLPDYRVIDATDLPEGGRRVVVEYGSVPVLTQSFGATHRSQEW